MDDGLTDVPAASVDLADTIGTGDTFNSGVLAYLAESWLPTRDRSVDIDASSMNETLPRCRDGSHHRLAARSRHAKKGGGDRNRSSRHRQINADQFG